MNRRCIALAMAAASSLALCSMAAAQEGEPITIGVAAGMTGVLSPWDVGGARGAEMAVEDINEQGRVIGRPLQLVISDTRSDPSLGPTAASQVLSQGAEM